MSDTPNNGHRMSTLIERLRLAGRDERLSTGQLYLDAADAIDQLERELKETELALMRAMHLINTLDPYGTNASLCAPCDSENTCSESGECYRQVFGKK